MILSRFGKCQTCGDNGKTYSYNGTYSCGGCLSLDNRGFPRKEIIERILGIFHEPRKNRLRKVRKRDWKVN